MLPEYGTGMVMEVSAHGMGGNTVADLRFRLYALASATVDNVEQCAFTKSLTIMEFSKIVSSFLNLSSHDAIIAQAYDRRHPLYG